ncbi:hypothetical protein K493DRAFT_336514 [Basidiobolus meristosporus CBS 931.73]|uniref:Uncharacterized protein n=1 Tax=Basidiobolus meristosporus CBS 931.73 TaxID=1314790 RepID=A0A1Y1YIH0_9FUNG|nr:hypothetical protein K493DRAFT_336514 [Basidiobolus meristosporus CBS 931.73]|eukprot:ORX97526.1 hypothetical protein K493DRAFT_336514 [Basidiobolus meristosporus CBS 931.73]
MDIGIGLRPQYVVGFVIAVGVSLICFVTILITYSRRHRRRHQASEVHLRRNQIECGVVRIPEDDPAGVTETLPPYTPNPGFNEPTNITPASMRSLPNGFASDYTPVAYRTIAETPLEPPPPVYQNVN